MSRDPDALAEISAASGVDADALAGTNSQTGALEGTPRATEIAESSLIEEVSIEDRKNAAEVITKNHASKKDLDTAIDDLSKLTNKNLRNAALAILLLQTELASPAEYELIEDLALDAVESHLHAGSPEQAQKLIDDINFVNNNDAVIRRIVQHFSKSTVGRGKFAFPRDVLKIRVYDQQLEEEIPSESQIVTDDETAGRILHDLYDAVEYLPDGEKTIEVDVFTKARADAKSILDEELRESILDTIAEWEEGYGYDEDSSARQQNERDEVNKKRGNKLWKRLTGVYDDE